MFARLLLMQERRDVNIKDILLYELTSYPLCLATEAGDLTAKSTLMQKLEEEISTIQERPINCFIYDGMVIVQKLPRQLDTFGLYQMLYYEK